MKQRAFTLVLAGLLVGAALALPATGIGLGDLKKKAQDKAKEAADKKAPETAPPETEAPAVGEAAPAAAASADVPISQISTKFDFVPGDKVLFADDCSTDEIGEFPARLKLLVGNFEVVEFEGRHWLRLAGDDGEFQLKGLTSLPERWTLEFDWHADKPAAFEVRSPGPRGQEPWWLSFAPHGNDVLTQANSRQSYSTLTSGDFSGSHHIAFMGQGAGLKVYVDRDRVMNVPEIESPVREGTFTFRIRHPASNPLLTNFRFAEKSEPKPDLLADGPFVTHGIYFASGSDKVQPESAPVLRQLAAYLKANPAVRVQITGHTDDVGADADNLDLSSRRAAAVAAVLAAEFDLEAGRFQTGGKGETVPIAPNDSPEGRSMNRRVEFAKIG